MTLTSNGWNTSYYVAAQYNVGGIIGLIRGQAVWPENCLYTGDLNATNGFTGPILGALRNNTTLGTRNNYISQFNTLWQGNDAGNLTMNSYYTSYSTNNRSFYNYCCIRNFFKQNNYINKIFSYRICTGCKQGIIYK